MCPPLADSHLLVQVIQSPDYEVGDVHRLLFVGWTREVVVVVTGERVEERHSR